MGEYTAPFPMAGPPPAAPAVAPPAAPVAPFPEPAPLPAGGPLTNPPTAVGVGGPVQGMELPEPASPEVQALSPTPPAGMAPFPATPAVGPGVDEDAPTIQPPEAPAEDDMPPGLATLQDDDDSAAPPAPDAAEAAPADDGMAFCTECGTANPKAFAFCGNCGGKIKPPMQETLYYAKAQEEEEQLWGKAYLIRPDGSEGGYHPLSDAEVIIGRKSGALFENDGYLSPEHARLEFENGTMILTDMGSLNGLFIKITQDEMLQGGDIFRIGQELLRFDTIWEPEELEDGTLVMGSPNPGYWGRLSLISGPGVDGSAFPLMGAEMVMGRERGDILFPDDGYISGTHAKIKAQDSKHVLSDLNSSNGTFLKLKEPREVPTGTFVLLGQQLFRIDLM